MANLIGDLFSSIDKNLNELLKVDDILCEIWKIFEKDDNVTKAQKKKLQEKLNAAGVYVGEVEDKIDSKLSSLKNEKFKMMEKTTEEILNVIKKGNELQSTSLSQSLNYANVLSGRTINNNDNKRAETLVVCSENANETFKKICQQIDPDKHGIKTKGHHVIRNNKVIFINVEKKSEAEKMKQLVDGLKLGDTVTKSKINYYLRLGYKGSSAILTK